MKTAVIYSVAKTLYSSILRELLTKAISDPDQEWDDVVLTICDKIFDYKE